MSLLTHSEREEIEKGIWVNLCVISRPMGRRRGGRRGRKLLTDYSYQRTNLSERCFPSLLPSATH